MNSKMKNLRRNTSKQHWVIAGHRDRSTRYRYVFAPASYSVKKMTELLDEEIGLVFNKKYSLDMIKRLD